MTAPELPHAPEADAVGAPVERPVRPLAWLHTVRVLNGALGELDEALSFAPDNFPLGEAGLFESLSVLPLYGPAAIDAAVAAERERWIEAVMAELDGNGQAHAIVAYATRA